jgi:hypothetical protein
MAGAAAPSVINHKKRELGTAWSDAPLESDYGMVIECEQVFKLQLLGRSVNRGAAHVVVPLNLWCRSIHPAVPWKSAATVSAASGSIRSITCEYRSRVVETEA